MINKNDFFRKFFIVLVFLYLIFAVIASFLKSWSMATFCIVVVLLIRSEVKYE